jgi:ABC-2 type transport system permease protein
MKRSGQRQDSQAAAREPQTRLPPRDSLPALRGFTTMWGLEQRHWWHTRRWVVQVLLWVVLLDGLVLAQLLDARSGGTVARAAASHDAADMFFVLGMLATAVGIIVTLQASVAGEVNDGTAAWVLSKPLSRPAYLLAKLTSDSSGFVTLAVGVPIALFIAEVRLLEGHSPGWTPVAAAVALWVAHVTFYVSLLLLLGVSLRRPAACAGTALTLLVAGQVILGSSTSLPWGIPTLAGDIASGDTHPAAALIPFMVTLTLSSLLQALSVWRFHGSEM